MAAAGRIGYLDWTGAKVNALMGLSGSCDHFCVPHALANDYTCCVAIGRLGRETSDPQ